GSVAAGPVDCTGESFTFTDLTDGNYVLFVVAVDNVNNSTLPFANFRDFRVDSTPPTITFVAPTHPGPQYANIVDKAATSVGTFPPGSAASPNPTFTCTVDSLAPEDCADGSYDISALTEGGHMVSITAQDCVGNSTTSSLVFFVDVNAPDLGMASDVTVDS